MQKHMNAHLCTF